MTDEDKRQMKAERIKVMEHLGIGRQEMDNRELYRRGKSGPCLTLCSFQIFRVGAALLTDSGEVFAGGKRGKLVLWWNDLRRANGLRQGGFWRDFAIILKPFSCSS